MTRRPVPSESTHPSRRRVATSLARAALSVTALLVLYAELPLGAIPIAAALGLLVVGLIGLGALLAWQFAAVGSARHPGLRAAEALAVAITLFLVMFAATYFRWSVIAPEAFSTRLSRVDALYFTVTTFGTVGFGDLSAVSAGARLLVTGQIIADLLLLGVVVNAMVGAARRTVDARDG